MALKVELKPGERIILGECVITNADQRARLLIEGQVPILREKDILTPELRGHAGQAHLSRRAIDVHVQGSARATTTSISHWCATSWQRRQARGRTSKVSTTIS